MSHIFLAWSSILLSANVSITVLMKCKTVEIV